MKRLFETVDLEAELFEDGEEFADEQLAEYDLTEVSESSLNGLENLSEDSAEGFPALELTLELSDGRILEYEVAAVFVHEEKEYVGLHPKSDTEGLVHIMQMTQGENDEIELLPIKEEEELQAVYHVFFQLYADDYEEEASEVAENDEKTSKPSTARRFHVR